MKDSFKPEARTGSIVTQEVSGELLVYDLESNKAHCLNSTAGFVWKTCDGTKTAAEIREDFERATGEVLPADILSLAIEQLYSVNLLVAGDDLPVTGISRRKLLKKAGFAAAVALPLVSSLAIPSTVFASASGLPSGSPCTSPIECSSGVCVPGAPSFCA